jgi:hypothetical protein
MSATLASPERHSSITMKPFASSEHSIDTKELNSADRCDRCGAAAYVRVVKNSQELLFCGNHGRKVYSTLTEAGWKVDDQTHRAFARPSAPQTDD